MEVKKFLEKLDKKLYNIVNSLIHRDALTPPYNPAKINVTEFNDGLRPKYFEVRVDSENNYVEIDWLSQKWSKHTEPLIKEIERWMEYNLKESGVQEPIDIYIKLHDRDKTANIERNITVYAC